MWSAILSSLNFYISESVRFQIRNLGTLFPFDASCDAIEAPHAHNFDVGEERERSCGGQISFKISALYILRLQFGHRSFQNAEASGRISKQSKCSGICNHCESLFYNHETTSAVHTAMVYTKLRKKPKRDRTVKYKTTVSNQACYLSIRQRSRTFIPSSFHLPRQ